jgi:hypothetical protein
MGVLTTSAIRAGSQKLIPIPGLVKTGGGAGHAQSMGGGGSKFSEEPGGIMGIPPILMGNMQLQHISVIGLGNLPPQTIENPS